MCVKAALNTGMKMFFSVFFGAFFAIMAAAATLYCIKEYEDAESAKKILRETAVVSEPAKAPQMVAAASPVTESTPNSQPLEMFTEPTLIQPVTVKTVDGEITIPAGQVVHVVNEKTKPGTILINYEGYTFTVPSAVIASSR